ncbi:serine hydrolase domain-containing protein [Mesorhizobium sp. CAU 1741]|uniref:serine hydrolase domain-containing protein n=1 Tax=Mesorhizobium sp. CAU 1741 TaxID=3140366 RepID=UPI00325B16F7
MRNLTSAIALIGCVWSTGAVSADRTDLAIDEFTGGTESVGIVENKAFVAPRDAKPATAPFTGTIALSEVAMTTDPGTFKSNDILGKDPQVFPAAVLSFVTVDDDLVPSTQDVQRYGSTANGTSFWDIIVQPGKVWSEDGDDGWNRASFPFSLMHSIEGETHNGVAMFLYKDGEVSDLRFQVVSQTAPFYVEDYFTAAGLADASLSEGSVDNEEEIAAKHRQAMDDAEKLADWQALVEKFGEESVDGFNGDINSEEIVVDGLGVDGTFYLKSCPTVAGELPYCDRQRFGVWSVTKAAANTVAMLRLAEKYGPGVFDEKIAEYVNEAEGLPGWDQATFGDLLNMASGMGYGSQDEKPYNITDPFLDPYMAWYEAPTVEGKLDVLLEGAEPYPWGNGEVARYRDEDMFLLGEAMSRYVRAHDEAYHTIWDLVTEEVYEPIGIHYAPINKTIEAASEDDQPLMAFGFYPTISDMVKIAKLFQNDGRVGDKQILNAEKLADIAPSEAPIGFPTGDPQRPYYLKAFWRAHMDSRNGCSFYYPTMVGWGANYVALFPNDVFAIRLANDWDDDAGANRMDSLELTADRVGNLCE